MNKKIYIEKIELENFGGIARGEIQFNEQTNEILGSSGTGKSSFYFGYLWALGFNVPTFEPMIDGYRVKKLVTRSTIYLNVNNQRYTLSKINEPQYKVNKFSGEEEYYGTGFKYLFDGNEEPLGNYKQKISDLFGADYFSLELLSNISLFNNEDGKRWDKNERRKYLFKLFDLENKIKELNNEKEFATIKEYLDKGKDESEINQLLNTQKTAIEKEQNDNQVIIAEKQKELVEYTKIDFKELETQKNTIFLELEKLNNQSKENSLNNLQEEKRNEILKLKAELNKLNYINNNLQQEHQNKIYKFQNDLKLLEQDIQFCNQKITKSNSDLEDLEIEKSNWEEMLYDNSNNFCKLCKQELPPNKINESISTFENQRLKEINQITIKAQNLGSEQRETKTRLNTLTERKQATATELQILQANLLQLNDTTVLENQIKALMTELDNMTIDNSNIETQNQISNLKLDYEKTLIELAKQNEIVKIQNRIDELKNRSRELAQQDSERIIKKQALQSYIQRKVGMVNQSVNENFVGVKFNFFHFLSATAAKDFELICECTLKGTEYSALSSGEKVYADWLTNNSLRKILNINVPQFIDDVVLSTLDKTNYDWQRIDLITTQNKLIDNVILIKDCYSLKDCDIKNKGEIK